MVLRSTDSRMLTKEQLGAVLNLPPRRIDALRKKRLIPHFKYGYRTLRYDLEAVERALKKIEIHEVGRN